MSLNTIDVVGGSLIGAIRKCQFLIKQFADGQVDKKTEELIDAIDVLIDLTVQATRAFLSVKPQLIAASMPGPPVAISNIVVQSTASEAIIDFANNVLADLSGLPIRKTFINESFADSLKLHMPTYLTGHLSEAIEAASQTLDGVDAFELDRVNALIEREAKAAVEQDSRQYALLAMVTKPLSPTEKRVYERLFNELSDLLDVLEPDGLEDELRAGPDDLTEREKQRPFEKSNYGYDRQSVMLLKEMIKAQVITTDELIEVLRINQSLSGVNAAMKGAKFGTFLARLRLKKEVLKDRDRVRYWFALEMRDVPPTNASAYAGPMMYIQRTPEQVRQVKHGIAKTFLSSIERAANAWRAALDHRLEIEHVRDGWSARLSPWYGIPSFLSFSVDSTHLITMKLEDDQTQSAPSPERRAKYRDGSARQASSIRTNLSSPYYKKELKSALGMSDHELRVYLKKTGGNHVQLSSQSIRLDLDSIPVCDIEKIMDIKRTSTK